MAEGGQTRRREVRWEGVADRYARAKLAQAYGLLAPRPALAPGESEAAGAGSGRGSGGPGGGLRLPAQPLKEGKKREG